MASVKMCTAITREHNTGDPVLFGPYSPVPPCPPPSGVLAVHGSGRLARRPACSGERLGLALCQVSTVEGRRLPHWRSTSYTILSLIEFYPKTNLGKQLTGTSKVCISGIGQG